MAAHCYVLLAVVLCCCGLSRGISLLDKTVKCRSLCERTYPLHTYPTVRDFQTCQRGCYHAVKFQAWASLGFRIGSLNCSKGCMEYFPFDSHHACELGCDGGKTLDRQMNTPTASGETPPAKNQLHGTMATMILKPVLFLHAYGRGMFNRLTYYIQSSTSYYFRSNNGRMVVVNIQSPPEVYVASSQDYDRSPGVESDKPQPKKEQQEITSSYSEQHESWIVVRRGHHWLHCVSHKSGVPMWVLSGVLFLSSFFLLWLCCAATATSPSAKKSSKPLKKAFLIRDFIASSEKGEEDVPLLKLDDTEQAGPLPSKSGAAVISM